MNRATCYFLIFFACAASQTSGQAPNKHAETRKGTGPMLAQIDSQKGTWAEGSGLHASGFGSGKRLRVPALSGDDIVSSIAREMEDDTPRRSRVSQHVRHTARGEVDEAHSVADVVGDQFEVPVDRIDGSEHSVRHYEADAPLRFHVSRSGVLKEGDVTEWGGDLGEEGVRTGAKPPPPKPREEFDWLRYFLLDVPWHLWAWLLALIFVLIVWIIAMYMVNLHRQNYEYPDAQKYIVRMLFMAPIYSTVAYVSLLYYPTAPYVGVIRDCYLAWTIYCLMRFFLEMLGGERMVTKNLAQQEQMQMPFPLSWTDPWAMGFEMLWNCKFGATQYIVILPTCATIIFVAAFAGIYEGAMWYTLDFWLALVILLSSTWAVYCIMTFYVATAPLSTGVVMHPLGKFLSILAVVFFCFYQGVLFRMILAIIATPDGMQWSAHLMVAAAEQWLIILEMIFFALLVNRHFPVEEFRKEKEALLEESKRKSGQRRSTVSSSAFV